MSRGIACVVKTIDFPAATSNWGAKAQDEMKYKLKFWKLKEPMKREVISKNAPAPVGPYSQGIAIGQFIFISGQIPLDPKTGIQVSGDIKAQTEQVLKNVRAVLEASGASLDDVVKVTVFLNNMDDFPAMNKIYSQYFTTNLPARSCVEISRLPKNVGVEIEAIAVSRK